MRTGDDRERIDGRVARAQRRREHTKEQILDAASRCFSRKGLHATSIQDILDDAGIARGTFYIHFQSKQQIFAELMTELLEAVRRSLPRVSVEPSAPPIVDQLVDNLCRLYDELIQRRYMVAILARGAVGQEAGLAEQIEAVFEQIQRLVWRSLETGREMGIIRNVPIRAATLLIVGAVKEGLLDTLSMDHIEQAEVRQLIRDLTEMALAALSHAP